MDSLHDSVGAYTENAMLKQGQDFIIFDSDKVFRSG